MLVGMVQFVVVVMRILLATLFSLPDYDFGGGGGGAWRKRGENLYWL